MWVFIGLLSILGVLVCFIGGLVSSLRKKIHAKKFFIGFASFFVLFIVAMISTSGATKEQIVDNANSIPSDTVTAAATTPPQSPSSIKQDDKDIQKKEVKNDVVDSKPPIDIDAAFIDFTNAYYALSADDQSSTFDHFLKGHTVTWNGTVMETGSSNLYIYAGSGPYKNENWSDITSSKKEMTPYVVIVKMKDPASSKKLNSGDKVKVKGKIDSRGNVNAAVNWKLTEGELLDQVAVNKPTISKSEFDQIKSGMTQKEVTEIIGGPGETISESGNKGEPFHTVMIMYEGEGKTGANANFMFQDDKLINKAQFGL